MFFCTTVVLLFLCFLIGPLVRVGTKRLVDFTLADIPITISLINTTRLDGIVDVLNTFDLSVCAIR